MIVGNFLSTIEFCCGVPGAVNSNLIPKFSSLQFSVFSTIVKSDVSDVDFIFLSNIFDPLYQNFHLITFPHHTCESWGLNYLCTIRTVPHHATCHCMCYDVMCTSCGACTKASQLPL